MAEFLLDLGLEIIYDRSYNNIDLIMEGE